MSVESEILRIQHNVANAYAAVSEKGGEVPLQPTSANLAAAVASIPASNLTTVLVNAPIGAILAWSGTEDTVPDGWHICNGEDGTLDLRDKFVLGAGPNHAVGDEGGSEEVTLKNSQMPSHTHLLYVNGTSFTPTGKHSRVNTTSIANTNSYSQSVSDLERAGSNQPHPNMPPYYALLYIQKVSATPSDYVTTAGDGLSKDGETLNVDNPVRGIMTQAEFDALPEAQKAKGTYFVDDGSGGSCGEVYSTEETRIGTWTNEKPLYRQVIQITSPATTDSYQYYPIPSPPPIENIVKIDGVIHASSGYDSPTNCYRGDFWCSTQISKKQIAVQIFGSWLVSRPMDIVVEYTKTTGQEVNT